MDSLEGIILLVNTVNWRKTYEDVASARGGRNLTHRSPAHAEDGREEDGASAGKVPLAEELCHRDGTSVSTFRILEARLTELRLYCVCD